MDRHHRRHRGPQTSAPSISATGRSQVWVADQGDGTYRNPIIHADYSDPNVIRVGDDFYLVGGPIGYMRPISPIGNLTRNMSATQNSMAAIGAQHLNWSTIAVESPSEGIERQMVVGQNLMICRFRFAPFLVTPEHRHPHEQTSLVMSGRVRFFIEGEERICAPGDVLHFPSNCLHGATMMDEEVVLIDIFTPLREDFLANK